MVLSFIKGKWYHSLSMESGTIVYQGKMVLSIKEKGNIDHQGERVISIIKGTGYYHTQIKELAPVKI